MDKQWCDYAIEAGITFLATGLGVYGAFIVDNIRDKNAKRDLSKRLIRGLSNEISNLEKFFKETTILAMHTDYLIEVRILEDTVRDQIDYLDNEELVVALSNFRLIIKKISNKLSLWSHVNLEMRSSQNPQWGKIATNLSSEWNGLRNDSKMEIELIKQLLDKKK